MADEIADLEDGQIKVYTGNYSEYAYEKRAALLRQQQLYEIQQREIARMEMALKRYKVWVIRSDKFASRVHAMEARLARVDRLNRPVLERRAMGLELTAGAGATRYWRSGIWPNRLTANHVLRGVDLLVRHGERVGLVGPNGAGKSLLLRMILGQDEPTAGEIVVGPSVHMGYYAQQHETLDYSQTLIDTVRRAAPMTEQGAVAFLVQVPVRLPADHAKDRHAFRRRAQPDATGFAHAVRRELFAARRADEQSGHCFRRSAGRSTGRV